MESNIKEGVHNDRGDMGKIQDPRVSQFMVRRKSRGLRADKSRFTTKNYMDFDSDSENEKVSKGCFSCSSIKTQKSNTIEDSGCSRRLKPGKAMTNVSVISKNNCASRKNDLTIKMIDNEKESTVDSDAAGKNKESDFATNEKEDEMKKLEIILQPSKKWILEEYFSGRTDIYPEKEAMSLCANIHVFGVTIYFRVSQSPKSVIGLTLIFVLVMFLIHFIWYY